MQSEAIWLVTADYAELIKAILLGIIEGLTEFLPISSTGHLILFSELMGFKSPPGKVFEVVIQLGAILAIIFEYRRKLTVVAFSLHKSKESRYFVFILLLAFLPAMVIGFFAHGFIKEKLFNTTVVAVSLIIGGILIIIIERFVKHVRFEKVEEITIPVAIKIGFAQCLAMIPGVSRSGATVMSAVCLGVKRKAAAEFSFFLAIPTMLAATVYDVYKNYESFDLSNTMLIASGFIAAFITALLVVRAALKFLNTHGFAIFGYYRIIIGTVMLYHFGY